MTMMPAPAECFVTSRSVRPLHGMMDPDGRTPLRVDVPLVRPCPREKRAAMPLINLSMPHRLTLEAAQGSLATAVHKVHRQCRSAARSPWGCDRSCPGFSAQTALRRRK